MVNIWILVTPFLAWYNWHKKCRLSSSFVFWETPTNQFLESASYQYQAGLFLFTQILIYQLSVWFLIHPFSTQFEVRFMDSKCLFVKHFRFVIWLTLVCMLLVSTLYFRYLLSKQLFKDALLCQACNLTSKLTELTKK